MVDNKDKNSIYLLKNPPAAKIAISIAAAIRVTITLWLPSLGSPCFAIVAPTEKTIRQM